MKDRQLIAGNWKMNGLRASLAEFGRDGRGREGLTRRRSSGLPAGDADRAAGRSRAAARRCRSAARIATRKRPAPIPATSPPKCWPMPARPPSSSAIPSGAPIMARPMPIVRAKAEAALRAGLSRSSASARRRPSATPARRSRCVGRQLEARCRRARRRKLVVAYEPVWAIGTGLTPTAADIAEVHAAHPQFLVGRFGPRARRSAFSMAAR